MRYRISNNISFLQPKGYVKSMLGILYTNAAERILLKDSSDEREFVINNTIKTFIEKFALPKTFEAVTAEVAEEVNTSVDATKNIIEPFFKYILHRKFIVAEHTEETKPKPKRLFHTGTIVNRYKIKTALDVSERIDVYTAVDIKSKKNVVIKLLKKPKSKAAKELQREFNFLRSLNACGISPKAKQFYSGDLYTYFVQEFIEGVRLPLYLQAKKTVKLNNIIDISFKIIAAFKKIHARTIVHGDIHPSNIIVTPRDEVKVIDFGLALHQQADKNERINFGGAYYYMPPERITKTTAKKFWRRPDFYSDVYQLGIIIYTLLYDEFPFNGLTWEQLSNEIKHKEIVFANTSCHGFEVPEWVKNFISQCTAKKASQRFINAQQMYRFLSKNIKSNGN